MTQSEKIILIDTDVVSHFIVGGYITVLPSIFKYRIHILNIVFEELLRMPQKKLYVENLVNRKLFMVIDFPENDVEISKEYFRLQSLEFRGKGESACMAVVRFSENILASSNLKDIKRYCDMHKIKYLTTMDFLCEAMRVGKMSEAECDDMLGKAKKANQKLPVTSMREFKCRNLEI